MFDFLYKRTHLIYAIIAGMFVFGILGLINMPKNLFPDSNRPEIVIFTQMPGASAKTIATSISKPIEEEMATLSNVYEIKSSSVANFSIVRVIFNYKRTLKDAAVDVSNALNRIKAKLKGATPSIYMVGDFTAPVDVFSVSSDKLTLSEIRKIVDSYIKPKLLSNKEIGNVEVFGGYQGSLVIKVDEEKLKKYNLSIENIINIIKTSNIDTPIGFIANKKFITLMLYNQKDVNKLKNLIIAPNIKLSDIADIKFSYATNNSLYIGNGKNAIAISIQRAPGGNLLATSDAARKVMDKIKKEYPLLDISVSDTQRNLVEQANINMIEALRDAIIFTVLVILLFLTNLRALIAAAITIPMVFFGTIALLYLLGLDLNIIVYTGIILALGMLVDDAIVVLENIERHRELKDKNFVYNGTKEVLVAVFSGTFATVAVIFPLMLVGGYPGKIFTPLVLTLIIALTISYFLAISFIPKIAEILYKNGTKKTKFEILLESLYQKTIAKLINPYISILKWTKPSIFRKIILIMGAIFILIGTTKNIIPLQGRDLMPPMDTGIMKAQIDFSNTISANETKKRLKPFLEWLNEQNWVKKSSISIGTEFGVLSLGGGGSNSASMTIIATDRFKRKESIWQLEQKVRNELAKLKGVKNIAVFDYGATALSSISAPLDVQFRSENIENLPNKANEALKILQNVRGLTTIKTSWDKDYLEAVLKIDEKKAIFYGLTPIKIISQLALKDEIIGIYTKYPSLATEFIKVRFKGKNLANLRGVLIDTIKGKIPLEEIATIKRDFTYSKIDRYNLEYSIDVLGYRNTRPISKITDEADKLLKENGITNYYQVGDVKEFSETFGRLAKAIIIGVVMLILTLMVIYRSLKLALVMIVVLPLSLIGAWIGLLIANKPMCMPAMVGVLLLFGIIIKNSVLLIDFYKEFIKNSDSFNAAIESIKVRFRPVMMTAFSTIAGMIPIALEWAIGLERLSPIAIIAIGGLLVGTFLTLVYVPMFAYIFYKK